MYFSQSIFFAEYLSLNIVIHIHKIAYALYIVGNVSVAVYGVLDSAGGYRKIHHIHRLEIIHHGVYQAAGKSVAAAYTVENVKGEQPAFKGVPFIPHKGLKAVFTAAVGVADMAGYTFNIGVFFDKMAENLVLLLIGWLEGYSVLPVALGMVVPCRSPLPLPSSKADCGSCRQSLR